MARVTTVQKSRKDQTCSKCGDALPKGSAYRHASPGFRSAKIVRCLKAECAFRASDLTTSHLAEVYAAQEAAEDALPEAASADDVGQILQDVADAAREVASTYEEAAEAMGEAGYENQERADALEGYADELEGFEADDDCEECAGTGYLDQEEHDEADDADECLVCDGTGKDLDALREEAVEALGNLDL